MPFWSLRDFSSTTFGNEESRRPTVSGWAVPSGCTSETTAQIAVSGEVVDSRTCNEAGPAETTFWARAGEV